MTATPALLKRPAAHDDDVVTLLREIRDELRAMRVDLRRQNFAAPALIEALAAEFGPGRFTVAGLLSLVSDYPHDALAVALADAIDMNASPRSRATALGTLLRKLPEVETVAEQRGCAVYRLRT